MESNLSLAIKSKPGIIAGAVDLLHVQNVLATPSSQFIQIRTGNDFLAPVKKQQNLIHNLTRF